MVAQEPEKVMDINIELAHGKFKMDDAFELRVQAIEVGKASEELWNNITPAHQEVLTQIFKRALEVMHANTERFLCNIITGEPGDLVNINLKVLMSKIEEQVEIITTANEFEREAAKRAMIATIAKDIAPLSDEEFLGQVSQHLEHGVQIPNSAVERLVKMLDPDAVVS